MERQPDPARQAAAFQEAANRLQGIRESEVPYPAGYDLGINPDQGRVPGTNEDPFPKVVGRTRFTYGGPDPIWRGAEELAMATGREEKINLLLK